MQWSPLWEKLVKADEFLRQFKIYISIFRSLFLDRMLLWQSIPNSQLLEPYFYLFSPPIINTTTLHYNRHG